MTQMHPIDIFRLYPGMLIHNISDRWFVLHITFIANSIVTRNCNFSRMNIVMPLHLNVKNLKLSLTANSLRIQCFSNIVGENFLRVTIRMQIEIWDTNDVYLFNDTLKSICLNEFIDQCVNKLVDQIVFFAFIGCPTSWCWKLMMSRFSSFGRW